MTKILAITHLVYWHKYYSKYIVVRQLYLVDPHITYTNQKESRFYKHEMKDFHQEKHMTLLEEFF